MHDNIINIAKSPLTDAFESACNNISTASICGNLATAIDIFDTIKPKSLASFDTLNTVSKSIEEVSHCPITR